MVCKVKGFSLNVRGAKQLNYDITRQNILDEILHLLDERRKTLVVNPTLFVRNPTLKKNQDWDSDQVVSTCVRQASFRSFEQF